MKLIIGILFIMSLANQTFARTCPQESFGYGKLFLDISNDWLELKIENAPAQFLFNKMENTVISQSDFFLVKTKGPLACVYYYGNGSTSGERYSCAYTINALAPGGFSDSIWPTIATIKVSYEMESNVTKILPDQSMSKIIFDNISDASEVRNDFFISRVKDNVGCVYFYQSDLYECSLK